MKKRTLLMNAQLPPSLDLKLATVLIVVTLVGLPACNRTEPAPASPIAPTTGVVTTVPTLTVSGVVSEDGIPIANARVVVQFSSCGGNCASGSEGLTDMAGRYTIGIRDLSEAADVWATARKDGYVQRCVATTMALHANTSLDVKLTSIANSIAPLVGAGFSRISGTVFETSPTRRPVEGVYVTLSSGNYYYDEFAYTITDTSGRYLICGLPQEPTYLTATKAGYKSANASAASGMDAIVDIEIARQ
jgi:hypothetical protein